MNIDEIRTLTLGELRLLRSMINKELDSRLDKALIHSSSPEMTEEEIQLIRDNKAVQAVKSYKERNQCGLELAYKVMRKTRDNIKDSKMICRNCGYEMGEFDTECQCCFGF